MIYIHRVHICCTISQEVGLSTSSCFTTKGASAPLYYGEDGYDTVDGDEGLDRYDRQRCKKV